MLLKLECLSEDDEFEFEVECPFLSWNELCHKQRSTPFLLTPQISFATESVLRSHTVRRTDSGQAINTVNMIAITNLRALSNDYT